MVHRYGKKLGDCRDGGARDPWNEKHIFGGRAARVTKAVDQGFELHWVSVDKFVDLITNSEHEKRCVLTNQASAHTKLQISTIMDGVKKKKRSDLPYDAERVLNL